MQTNKEALIEFVRGASLTIVIVGGFFLTGLIIMRPEGKTPEKFEVVDHYGTCAVVRYRPENRAQDVYFLDCGNQHLSE